MALAIYLGDEVSAAGYRLAGMIARVPGVGEEATALARARSEASLVVVSTTIAARIPTAELRSAQLALAPIVVLVPDVLGETPLPDIASRLRAELGMSA